MANYCFVSLYPDLQRFGNSCKSDTNISTVYSIHNYVINFILGIFIGFWHFNFELFYNEANCFVSTSSHSVDNVAKAHDPSNEKWT